MNLALHLGGKGSYEYVSRGMTTRTYQQYRNWWDKFGSWERRDGPAAERVATETPLEVRDIVKRRIEKQIQKRKKN